MSASTVAMPLSTVTAPAMLNPALLGSEDSVLLQPQAMTPSLVASTSHYVQRRASHAPLPCFAPTTSPRAAAAAMLYAPTPLSSGASCFEPLFAATPCGNSARGKQLTPLQEEVRRIRDSHYSQHYAQHHLLHLNCAEAAAAATLPPADADGERSAVLSPSAQFATVSPMHLGGLSAEAVFRGAHSSRPLTPALDGLAPLPVRHNVTGACADSTQSHTTPQLHGYGAEAATPATSPLPAWAAPSVKAEAASSFRREGHGGGARAREHVVSQHRKVVAAVSPVSCRIPSWHPISAAAIAADSEQCKRHDADDSMIKSADALSGLPRAPTQPGTDAACNTAAARRVSGEKRAQARVVGVEWVSDTSSSEEH